MIAEASMKKSPIWILLVLTVTVVSAQNKKTTVAVLDLDPTSISAEDAQFLSDRLRTELVETGAFTVVEREKMTEVLKEQGFQASGCTSVECAVQIGRLLNVQQIIAGNIGKIDELYSISVRLIDIQSGVILKTATWDYKGKLSEALTEVMPEVAGMLAEKENNSHADQTKPGGSGQESRFAADLKFGWAFLTYTTDLNDQIDQFAQTGNDVRLDNFPNHSAFTIEARYLPSEDWQIKFGGCLENMTSPWTNEFDKFPSDVADIKNLTDISLERKFSFAQVFVGIDYIFWKPGGNQEWYLGAEIGSLTMSSYFKYAYSKDLIPQVEEGTKNYTRFALQLTSGFNYLLSRSFYLGVELGAQAAAKYNLSPEQKPANFPAEIEPIIFPKELSVSGLVLQLTAGYRF
jgi:TolB-like protein